MTKTQKKRFLRRAFGVAVSLALMSPIACDSTTGDHGPDERPENKLDHGRSAPKFEVQLTSHAWSVADNSTGFVAIRFGSTEIGLADTLMAELPGLIQDLGRQCQEALKLEQSKPGKHGHLALEIQLDRGDEPRRAYRIELEDRNSIARGRANPQLVNCLTTQLRARNFVTPTVSRANIYIELDYDPKLAS